MPRYHWRATDRLPSCDHKTQTVIYRNSFSTLFQEWLTYPEATTQTKSFENVFLVPFPKDTVDITVDLKDNRRQTMATLTHMVMPSDILIRHIGEKNITPYVTLQRAQDTTRCIHIAYIAEGYRKDEMTRFIADCDTAMEALFAHEPFKSLRTRFNIIAVEDSVAGERNIRTVERYLEKHSLALQLRHLPQRSLSHHPAP